VELVSLLLMLLWKVSDLLGRELWVLFLTFSILVMRTEVRSGVRGPIILSVLRIGGFPNLGQGPLRGQPGWGSSYSLLRSLKDPARGHRLRWWTAFWGPCCCLGALHLGLVFPAIGRALPGESGSLPPSSFSSGYAIQRTRYPNPDRPALENIWSELAGSWLFGKTILDDFFGGSIASFPFRFPGLKLGMAWLLTLGFVRLCGYVWRVGGETYRLSGALRSVCTLGSFGATLRRGEDSRKVLSRGRLPCPRLPETFPNSLYIPGAYDPIVTSGLRRVRNPP
jgi:hypothetical protein